MIEAYPLQWPVGYPRSKSKEWSRFKCSFTSARDGILHEIRLLEGTRPVISTNIPIRKDGIPYSGFAQPKDTGVAVYFLLNGRDMVLACDRWIKIEDNLRAVEKAIEAMRGLDRWGVSDMLNRAFQGFTALPPPPDPSFQAWWHILGCSSDTPLGEVEGRYRTLAKNMHPDRGGSVAAMADLNWAIEQARTR